MIINYSGWFLNNIFMNLLLYFNSVITSAKVPVFNQSGCALKLKAFDYLCHCFKVGLSSLSSVGEWPKTDLYKREKWETFSYPV